MNHIFGFKVKTSEFNKAAGFRVWISGLSQGEWFRDHRNFASHMHLGGNWGSVLLALEFHIQRAKMHFGFRAGCKMYLHVHLWLQGKALLRRV